MTINKTVSVKADMGHSALINIKAGNHILKIDQPKAGGGQDQGASPLEYFLASIAGCIGSIARIKAMQDKIDLRGMKIDVDADMNVAGLLGKPTEDRVGFQNIIIRAENRCRHDTSRKEGLSRCCLRTLSCS